MPKVIWWGVLAVGLIVAGVALNTARQAARVSFTVDTPADRTRELARHWQILKPDGDGPFPAAILLSGCDGVHDNMDFWAKEMVADGRVALILDSHAPRKLDKFDSWRLVCSGQILTGAERAGDVAVALKALLDMPDVTNDVVLFGASHGGWSAMEMVGLANSAEVPPGLTEWPQPPDAILTDLAGLVLLYPYCGVLNGTRGENWEVGLPALMVLAENDTIVSTSACLERAEELQAVGAHMETVVIARADHGFDQRDKSALTTLEFNPARREEARTAIRAFLKSIRD
ncbi:dienelactone hydrolase family protein [Qingshengfaniella alkalisoli]|uniref:Dienelactone hydrolase n=1 Tax=Qingshengfaniella alkalisoli TaxID=2599296 RepID=A0A5B8J1E6_9RHOB|nr:dienelactone hydrolase family protein [Qingshengfaniella alkalisoli]QDY71603.1 dienelactone hydrolase [Qingshengfaniella alkalisoli]